MTEDAFDRMIFYGNVTLAIGAGAFRVVLFALDAAAWLR